MVQGILNVSNPATSNVLQSPELLFLYIFGVVLLIAGLLFSKQMGAYGAGLAIKYGQKGYRMAGGYAGKIALRSTVAPIGEKLKGSRITKGLMQAMPRTGAALGAALQKASEAGGRQKIAEQRAAQLMSMLSPAEQAKAFAKLPKREQDAMLAKQNAAQTVTMLNRASGANEQAAILEAIDRQSLDKRVEIAIMRSTDELVQALKQNGDDFKEQVFNKSSKEDLQRIANGLQNDTERRDFVDDVERLSPKKLDDALSVIPYFAANIQDFINRGKVDFDKMSEEHIKSHPAVMNEVAKYGTTGQIRKIEQRGGEVYDAYLEGVQKLGTNAVDVANALEAAGNRATARWLRASAEAKTLMGVS